MAEIVKTLSEALSEPLVKAYKAGGYGVAFLLLGAILMLAAFLRGAHDVFGFTILFVGVLLILGSCALFYFSDIRPLQHAQDSVTANRELVNGIQQAAVQLTDLVSELQSLAFKHSNQIAELLSMVRPALLKLPVVGKTVAESATFTKAETLSATIVEVTESTKQVIVEVRESLIHCDTQNLQKYTSELAELRQKVMVALKASGA